MAVEDKQLLDIVYSKNEIDNKLTLEATRVDTAIALKINTAEIGGNTGIPKLVDGYVQSANIKWATNPEALAGISGIVSMSPLRTQELINYNLSTKTALVAVLTSIDQLNILGTSPAKLVYFNSTTYDTNDNHTINAVDQEITVLSTKGYRLYGTFSIEAPLDVDVYFQPYVNNSPVGQKVTLVGRGGTKPVSASYDFIVPLIANDIVTWYGSAIADNQSITIKNAYVVMEKTIHG